MDTYLRTDEHIEATAALEMVAEAVGLVIKDPYRWKWAIIATHNAVQGFMVLALRHGNNLNVLKDHNLKKWLKAYESGENLPDEKMDYFLNLYRKTKNTDMLAYVHSRSLESDPDTDMSMEKINDLRNEFIHFIPKGWSLELLGLPILCLEAMKVISFLCNESGNIIWYEEEQKTRAINALESAITELNKVNETYNNIS